MNTFLWIAQSCLAFIFIVAGSMKAFRSKQKLLQPDSPFATTPIALTRLLGVLEILGALGIVAPVLTNIYPQLTTAVAVCMALVLACAAFFHLKRNQHKTLPLIIVLFVMAVAVAFLR